MTSLLSLIKRLEEAESGSQELDAHIRRALLVKDENAYVKRSGFNGEWCIYSGEWNGKPRLYENIDRSVSHKLWRAEYTSSLDAAVALAGRLLPGWWLHGLGRSPLHGLWWCQLYSLDEKRASEAEDIKSAPLAICLATLRALLAQETEKA